MAREVVIRKINDFDREAPADRVLEFALDGVAYVVDLDGERDDAFRAFVAPYVEVAHEKTKLSSGAPAKTAKAAKAKPDANAESKEARAVMRAWARSNGMDCPVRGVLPNAVREAYSAAVARGDESAQPSQLRLVEDPESAKARGPQPRDANKSDAERFVPNSAGVTPDMREWARENGIKMSNGYLKTEHRERYQAERGEVAASHEAAVAKLVEVAHG